MPSVVDLMPQLESDEAMHIQGLIDYMSDEQARIFATSYLIKRKDPSLVLLMAAIGFFGVAGIHRFYVGDVGVGILFLVTGGCCFIGTIIDLISHKQLALNYNIREAKQIAMVVKSST